jgi:hypothetical protein
MNKHNTKPRSKVSIGTYRADKLYPRVAQAAEKLLAKAMWWRRSNRTEKYETVR